MAWAVPEFDVQLLNSAGRALAKSPIATVAEPHLSIINNWRSSHAYPLNTFQITLRNKAKKFETDITVAQRIKRLESIHSKLSRQDTMRLSQMQDIAGCRVVFRRLANVARLVGRYKTSSFGHVLRNEKDYITYPKEDGYRCYHLVYEYRGTDHTAAYTGMRIEIQIRTQLQHAWATAVEAVGIFTRQALKSNRGDDDWLRFFALMAAAIAAIEKTPPVPGTPTTKGKLVEELTPLSEKLRVNDMLAVYNATLDITGDAKDVKYFLVRLEPGAQKITIGRFRAKESQAANAAYTRMESDSAADSAVQVVLVSVESIAALKRAYPNYFLDTNAFSEVVKRVLKSELPEVQTVLA